MNKNKIDLKFSVLVLIIAVAAISRFLPHPPNVTPVGAMALFGAAHFAKKWLAFLVPFLALWVSNLVFDNIIFAGYYEGFQWFGQPWVMLGFALIVAFGFINLKKITTSRLVFSSLVASAIFFLVSNFGAWLQMGMYPKTLEGLIAAYTAGIPLFINTIAGDLFYVAVLFGAYVLVKRSVPSLQMTK